MSFRSNVRVQFRANPNAEKEIAAKWLAAAIKGAQEVVAYAAHNHPYADRTGTNSRSIGWAASGLGQKSYGVLSTSGGSTGTAGVQSPGIPSVLVGTSSGYGGFLELGTRTNRPYPYILPAMAAKKQAIKDHMTGIL